MNLPNEIILQIIENYLDYKTLSSLLLINKKYNKISYLSYRHRFVKFYFPLHILSILNYNNQYPLLKFEKKFVGWTDYIDAITIDDVSSPVMLSVDFWKRPVIIFRLQIRDKIIIQTIFQRYIYNSRTWVSGSNYGYSDALGATTLKKEEDFQLIKSLINKREIYREISLSSGMILRKYAVALV